MKPGDLSTRCVKSTPFFYGYVVAVFGAIGLVATGPGQTPVIGTTITRVSEDLGISRTQISSLYLAGTIGSACTLPFVGRVLDAVGPPPLFAAAVLGLGFTCIVYGTFARSWMSLLACFYCLRVFGQGILMMVSGNAVNLWFEKKRGRVMACVNVVTNVCLTGLFSSSVKFMVGRDGWRPSYILLGQLEICAILPLVLFLKQKPEVYGLVPDGHVDPGKSVKVPEHEPDGVTELHEAELGGELENVPLHGSNGDTCSTPPGKASGPEPSCIGRSDGPLAREPASHGAEAAEGGDFTLREALRTGALWVTALMGFGHGANGTALLFHLDAIFDGAEYQPHLYRVYLSSAAVAPVVTLTAGYLVDRGVPPMRFTAFSGLASMIMLFTAGLVVLTRANPFWLFIVGMSLGLQFGCGSQFGVAFANWFGRTHLGKISSILQSAMVLGSAAGPAFFSVGRDFSQNFGLVTCASAIWPAACTLLCLCTPAPRRSTGP